MVKFEYKLLDILDQSGFFSSGGKFNYEEVASKLNEFGREGWEVVGTTDINRYQGATRNLLIILKRAITENN